MLFAYPRLYRRTAFYIGLALVAFVILGAAIFAAIAAWELSDYVETRNSGLAREAAAVLAAGDKDALRDWLDNEAAIPENVGVFVLDADGNDLRGQRVPEAFERIVRESVVGEPEAPGSNFRGVRLAPQIFDAAGNPYAFLVVPRDIKLWGNRLTVLGLVLVALLVIAVVAWAIAGSFGRPIGEIQHAVQNLAGGDTSARVPAAIAGRRDEVGRLAENFNRMADQLNRLIEGRERLMSELSHELRSPLTRLQAALALASARNRLDPQEKARLEAEIQRMNKVIGEILRYSRLDTSVEIQIRVVRIDYLLERLVKVEEVEAAGKQCRLHLDAVPKLTVAGDPDMLHSAFENILRNAIRFAPQGSTIELQADHETTRDAKHVVVSVRDRGPGIPAADIDHIFEPYVRAGTDPAHDTNAKHTGTGLGLAIVKRVVERHHGEVRAENCPDGGLRMTVRIPAADLV